MNELNAKLNCEFVISSIFHYRTIEKLSAFAKQPLKGAEGSEYVL
jgi:hypothetical protein